MPERGGPSAQSGFLYQNLVSAEFLMKLLSGDDNIISIQIEGRTPVDDLIINRQNEPAYYVQVRERAPKGNWTSKLLDRQRFWESVVKQIQHEPEGQILFISESSTQKLTELATRARSMESTTEFISNINETKYLLAELQTISQSTGITGQPLKDLLARLTFQGSYGSADMIKNRILGVINPRDAEQFLSAILTIVTESAKKRAIINRDSLIKMLANKGIPKISMRRRLILESLDDLIERGHQNVLRLLTTKLRVKYNNSVFVSRRIQDELESRLEWTSKDTLKIVRDIRRKLNKEMNKEESWDNLKIYKDVELEFAKVQKALENNSVVDWFRVMADIESSAQNIAFPPDCDVIKELKTAAYKLDAIVAKAGIGKTNIAANFASIASEDHLVSLFTADDLYLSNEEELTERIKEEFRLPTDIDFYDFLEQINPLLKSQSKKLLIIIDAINESPNYALLKANIERLALKTNTYEVNIYITCRDIFWGSFFYNPADTLASILRKLHMIDRFSPDEFKRALTKYCKFFHLHIGVVSREASHALRHPLLLRFFCETYGGGTRKVAILKHISDIRLKELFDKYWDKKAEMIRSKIRHRNRIQIDSFLLTLAKNMLESQKRWLALDTIIDSAISQDYETPDSPYNAILDEDVIIEKAVSNNQIILTFVYEEFMEYMMARAIYSQIHNWTREGILANLKSMLIISITFPNVYGMLRYLTILLKEQNKLSLWWDLVKADQKWGIDALRSQQQIKAELWDMAMADTVSLVARVQLNSQEQVIMEYEWFDICMICLRRYKKQFCEILMYLTFTGIGNRDWQLNKKAARQLLALAKRQNEEAMNQLKIICSAFDSSINIGETELGIRCDADTKLKLRSLIGSNGYLNITLKLLEDIAEGIRSAGLGGLLQVDIFGVSR